MACTGIKLNTSCMNFIKTKTNSQLKKWRGICMGIAIGMVLLLFFTIGFSLYQISEGIDNSWLPSLVPTILCPLTFIPLLLANAVNSELKQRSLEQ